ncbi:MAG: NADH-quinone oxidoreductase subunit N [Bacteroidetes bacterium]|nr:NADH-quinone oxidoreductase subunit N [Rhodothermia bacterium]MCS7155704.1 NADH-quinone oxidoreductase subunit N [Bacteroidota bacterium]MCX7906563.1 NADH-quinone oxidoreductase subunit N [Bacteroidota bacterium]MDW8137156.1 NADH-quinone oxidoreductase subunit N [Bacteroidota bacterium]MDW8284974.1 NADH-quinone oxidoreductase subunit N [Bacteroidota bacterium]
MSAIGPDTVALMPMILLALGGLLILLWDGLRQDSPALSWIALLVLLGAAFLEANRLQEGRTLFGGLLRVGGYAAYASGIFLLGGALTVLLSRSYLPKIGHAHGEVYALLLFALVGMMVMASANDLVLTFLGLETMSIALYVLTGLAREDAKANEAAMKYFLLGAFATGFLLYGIALLYGTTGTTRLDLIPARIPNTPLFWVGVGLLLVGLLFKIAAAPFHLWTPDAYQGAPTPISGFMAAASKAAAMSVLLLVLGHGLGVVSAQWSNLVAAVAALTLVVGNGAALVQEELKRLLAYSSIAHVGYALVGLAAANAAGYAGVLFYLLAYAGAAGGAFGVVALWERQLGRQLPLRELAGMGYRHPFLSGLLAVFLLSLVGLPPTAGFMAKYAVFAAAVQAQKTWLALVGVITSMISAYYYLRVLVLLWRPEEAQSAPGFGRLAPAALALAAALVLLLGLWPSGVLELVQGFFEDTGLVLR